MKFVLGCVEWLFKSTGDDLGLPFADSGDAGDPNGTYGELEEFELDNDIHDGTTAEVDGGTQHTGGTLSSLLGTLVLVFLVSCGLAVGMAAIPLEVT